MCLALARRGGRRFVVATRKADDTNRGDGRPESHRVRGQEPVGDRPGGHRADERLLAESRGGATVPDGVGEHQGIEQDDFGWGRGAALARQRKDGEDYVPLAGDDPLRLSVRILGKDEKPVAVLSLDGGNFEVTLPGTFLKSNLKTLTVDWTDFYR